MSPVSKDIRQKVFERANFRCEYCLAPEIIGVSMEVDHIVPQATGGSDELDNLCLACDRCNAAKSAAQSGVDPETAIETPLFNPRSHAWTAHFSWSEDFATAVGKTATGRATIERLHLNHEKREVMRRLWVQLELHPPAG